MALGMKLLMEYEMGGKRLGREILESQALFLVEDLRSRLHAQADQLDLSPASLRTLEQLLLNYVQAQPTSSKQINSWPQQEILILIREIAAYMGLTLSHNLTGKWESDNSLMGPLFTIDGPIKVVDGSHSYTSQHGMSLSLGNIAANGLDLAIAGEKPNFYSAYLRAKRRVAKQRL